jgi:hypothetical protein
MRAKGSMVTSIKSFRDSMRYHGSRGCILMENTSSGGFSTVPHCKDHPAVLGSILDLGGLAAIFAGLAPIELLNLERFAGENPGCASCQSSCPTFVHHYGMGLASSGIHLPDLLLISLHLSVIAKKYKVYIE